MTLAFVGASRDSYAGALERLEQAASSLTTEELRREGDDLFAFAALLHSEGSLRRAFSDAALPAAAKNRPAGELLGERFSPPRLKVGDGPVTNPWARAP